MEMDSGKGLHSQAKIILDSLPQEGLILHVTRRGKLDSILEKGLLPGQRKTIWFYSFQVANEHYFKDFSVSEISKVIERLRGSITEGLQESSLYTGLSRQYMSLHSDDYPAVIIARRLKKDRWTPEKVEPPGHSTFTREVDERRIPKSNIVLASTITPQEYEALLKEINSTNPPQRIQQTTDPKRIYYEYSVGRVLARKVVAELLATDFTVHQETNGILQLIKRLILKIH